MLARLYFSALLICTVALHFSCNKKDFLDEKPSTTLVVPTTLDDFQKLLDNYSLINGTPIMGEASSDDYYLFNLAAWQALPTELRNCYIWASEIYEGKENIFDWNQPYQQVLYANVVLEGIDKIQINSSNEVQVRMIKGWAYFIRGYAFFNLSQIFAKPYDEVTSDTDLGIPLRLQSDVTDVIVRQSIRETYDQIISDIKLAVDLLPSQLNITQRNRPCRPAAAALLARIYLTMRNYEKALEYANYSLQDYNKLMNYNAVPSFSRTNDEVLYQAEMGFGHSLFAGVISPNTIVDSFLYSTYSTNDLRKTKFFRVSSNKVNRFMGYTGVVHAFGGIATDEVFLTRSECLARLGQWQTATDVLNALLTTRFKPATFVPLQPSNQEEALNLILLERRKELVFRGLRWLDLRRLNKEGANITLKRNLNGQLYSLTPNSSLFALPIPPDEIRLSGIQQNPR